MKVYLEWHCLIGFYDGVQLRLGPLGGFQIKSDGGSFIKKSNGAFGRFFKCHCEEKST